jgi:hypothetical protein
MPPEDPRPATTAAVLAIHAGHMVTPPRTRRHNKLQTIVTLSPLKSLLETHVLRLSCVAIGWRRQNNFSRCVRLRLHAFGSPLLEIEAYEAYDVDKRELARVCMYWHQDSHIGFSRGIVKKSQGAAWPKCPPSLIA